MVSPESHPTAASESAAPSEASSAVRVNRLRKRVDESLSALVADRTPTALYDPVRYVLDGGGKRLRPVLLLLVASALDTSSDEALPAALAIEVFHNFTLVHDDIMDEAEERRGQPTVHKQWDTSTAILTGDVLMGLSYELLGRLDAAITPDAYTAYHSMVEQVCSGQALDAAFESRDDVSVDDYLQMIDGKTAALLATVFELGGIVGRASDGARSSLHDAGLCVGRAFQIQDDLLDLTARSDEWGKAVGGDLVTGKKTFLTLRALERAEGEEYQWFQRILAQGGLPREEVAEARDRMDALGVFDEARKAVEEYTEAARSCLTVLPDTEATTTIYWLLDRMEARTH